MCFPVLSDAECCQLFVLQTIIVLRVESDTFIIDLFEKKHTNIDTNVLLWRIETMKTLTECLKHFERWITWVIYNVENHSRGFEEIHMIKKETFLMLPKCWYKTQNSITHPLNFRFLKPNISYIINITNLWNNIINN